MFRQYLCCTLIAAFTLAASSRGAETSPDEKDAIQKQYDALLSEFEDDRRPREFAPRFFTFAKENSHHDTAIDALVWIVANRRYRPETAQALRLLEETHLKKKSLSTACDALSRLSSPDAERLLRAALEKSPHADVQAQACYHLAVLLQQQTNLHEQLEQQPAMRKRAEQYYGKDFSKHLVSLDAKEIEKEREKLFERLHASFSDIPFRGGTMGQVAAKELFAIRHLSVGKPASEIEAEDIYGSPFRLSDYRGKVVVVSFWGHW